MEYGKDYPNFLNDWTILENFLHFIFCRESQCKDSNEKKQVSAEETRQETPRNIFQRFDSLHD